MAESGSPIIIEGPRGQIIPNSGEPSESCPITSEDIKLMEAEFECFDEAKGWKRLSQTDVAEVWKKSDGSPIPLIKGMLFLPDVPLTKVLELVLVLERRILWDTRYSVLEDVEKYDDYSTLYWSVKIQGPTTDRDFVVNMFYGINKNGVYYLCGKNGTHPNKPEVPGLVRGETILTGMQLYPDKDDPNSTRVNILLQDDIKGYIPKFISNAFYGKAPVQWRDTLHKYYHDVYKHEKSEK